MRDPTSARLIAECRFAFRHARSPKPGLPCVMTIFPLRLLFGSPRVHDLTTGWAEICSTGTEPAISERPVTPVQLNQLFTAKAEGRRS